MNRPATLTDAVEVVRKSRLLDEDRLSAYLDDVRTAWPLDPAPSELFDDMVRRGLLTAFQGTQLKDGRWKGFEIGNYRVLDRLGQGGMGQVFLAEHATLGRRVALKILSRHTSSPLAMERFVREAQSSAKLNHPNIIRVHDINITHDPPFIVMEYADGITLQATVAKCGTLEPGDAAWITRQVATALEEASRHGLVHRDVKPANILVDRRGIARLLDLGIVRIEGENLTSEYAKNVILGTIDYLAPEQAEDSSNVDSRADIYSLGATLYFLLTGTTPVPDGTMRERIRFLQRTEPPDVAVLRLDVPAGLAKVLKRMMAKRREDRYQSPREVVEALNEFAHQSPQYPANLFRHQRNTLCDSTGSVTPPGGTHLPITMETEVPPPSVEFYKLPEPQGGGLSLELERTRLVDEKKRSSFLRQSVITPLKAVDRDTWWLAIWAIAGFAVIFGLMGIAFYVWK